MISDPVTLFYNKLKINDMIKREMDSHKTKEERITFLNAMRPYMNPIGKVVTSTHPDWIKNVGV